MALTPAEQAELDQLETQQSDHETATFGDPYANGYVTAVSKPARPEDETSSSFMRTLFGGLLRDPLANTVQTIKDIGTDFTRVEHAAIAAVGQNLTNAAEKTLQIVAPGVLLVGRAGQALNAAKLSVPDLPGSEHAGTAEKVGRSILSFVAPFATWSKALSVEEAGLSVGQRILRGAGAGALTDAISQDPAQTNMATMLKDTFGLDNPTLDALAYHADDDALIERLKAAATNVPTGILAEGIFAMGAAGLRAYRAWKGGREEAKGIYEAMEHDYGIKRPVSSSAEEVNPEAASSALMNAGEASSEPFNAAVHSILEENPPKTWEDVLTFLNRIVDDPKLDQKMVDELAHIAHDDPENALTRIGIDPAKLDYEAFDNPDAVENLHKALIDIYEKAGSKLGRTGERVSESAILHTAARSFASEADVLRALFGKTKNLPEILMGARMFVGGHAKRLLDDAEAALKALREGGEGAGAQEWQKFLESFYRHALYLGQIRGAGSEIGRALKSLQFVARHDPKQAIKYAEELAAKVPAGAKVGAEAEAKEQLQGLLTMDSNAERIMALSKLLETEGDTGAMAMLVRRHTGSVFKNVDGMVREQVGNLFSMSTAAYNLGASLTMMSLRGLGRWMAAAARAPLALAGGEQARLYRIAAADAWAYTDGVMMGWAESWRNMLTALKADGATELFINADNLGLKKLAATAAKWNSKGTELAVSGKNFERVDMRAARHFMALNPADRRALEQWVESYDMPRLMEGAMKWMARTAGVVINAAGTATRMGTILLVNAPDQFAGTLAYRAGRQAAAVREAAKRAAELGIEGRDLTTYLKARVAGLTDDVTGTEWADQAYETGFRDTVHKAGQNETRAVLFQDRLEGKINRALTRAHHEPSVFLPLAIPFLHTPLRILERSLIDYTPLGIFKSRIQQAILHGSPEQREQALSQLALGIMGMYLGYKMAQDRTIVGKDGSFYSTARMARESYTVHAFGDTFDFSRLDPIATIVGLSADYHEYMNTYYDPTDPEAESKGRAMFEAGAWAITANVLSKAYLQSLGKITDVVNSKNEAEFHAKFTNLWQDMVARRNVPAAGIQKGIRQIYDPWEHEAVSFYDKVLKETIGADRLPVKRDWLGKPVPVNFGERFTGLSWEPYKGDEDPLTKALDNISLDVRLPRKDYKGVKMTAKEYSRLLELRGQVVQDDYGTMEEALHKLIQAPEWGGLTREAKEFNVRKLVDGYTEKAHKALMAEDKLYAGRVYLEEAYQDQRNKGATPDELKAKTEEFKRELHALGYL